MSSLAQRARSALPGSGPLRERPWWPWLRRVLTGLFFLLVGWLIVKEARAVDWAQVLRAMREHPPLGLALAAALAAASHLLYSTFDLLGRARTGHRIGTGRVMLTTFVSYVFNLNFGALIGGVAFRYRLYDRLGLSPGQTSEVLAVSMLTNWLGYALVAGVAFALSPPAVPDDWPVAGAALRALGVAALALPLGYAALCAWSPQREWTIHGHLLKLPSLRFAALQLAMSSVNWMLIGGVVWALLQRQVSYPAALAALLVAAVAGVIAHVPAGLGVIEAVFIALLSAQIPKGELLASLLLYRGMYYLGPLALAIVLHLALESTARARSRRTPPARPG